MKIKVSFEKQKKQILVRLQAFKEPGQNYQEYCPDLFLKDGKYENSIEKSFSTIQEAKSWITAQINDAKILYASKPEAVNRLPEDYEVSF